MMAMLRVTNNAIRSTLEYFGEVRNSRKWNWAGCPASATAALVAPCTTIRGKGAINAARRRIAPINVGNLSGVARSFFSIQRFLVYCSARICCWGPRSGEAAFYFLEDVASTGKVHAGGQESRLGN